MRTKNFFLILGILFLEILFIFMFLLNYDVAWMNSEKFGVRDWILSNGSHWHKEDWGKFLNIDVIECNPYRLSRPLSNFVEVVDTKWRACLWEHLTPHPAVSLQWPFLWIVLPWLLYQTFMNMGVSRVLALTGVGVYIASVGFLGPIVMLFHPAKNLVNFFAVLAFFFFSLKYKELPSLSKTGGLIMTGGFLSLFLCFISDETGAYFYMVALLLFHRLWLRCWHDRRYGFLSGLAVLPLAYILNIKFFLPYWHWRVYGQWIHLNNYDCFPTFQSLFLPNGHFLWQNIQFLFADHPHLCIHYQQLWGHPIILSIQIIYVLTFIGLGILFFKHITRNDAVQKTLLGLIGAGVLLMWGYCFFQTFQLSLNVKAWGIWWYGSPFSLIYVFPLVFLLEYVFLKYQSLHKIAAVIALILILNGLTFSVYRIVAFKHQNLNRSAYSFVGIFKGSVDPYALFAFQGALERSACKRMYAHLYWLRWKILPEDVNRVEKDKCYAGPLASDFYFMTEENGYLPAELK